MSYNPKTATREQKWTFRMNLLTDFLNEIPFTTNQRTMINHHLTDLTSTFRDAEDAAQDVASGDC